ncbi:MAG: hypothetical protein IJW70_06525 [Clostridia bacterium]|nr:hypothetical protein [Clostridia bacterium]
MERHENTVKINKGHVKMIAHQGLFVAERGNSIPSFRYASQKTHYGIECDVHVTKDKQFVVMHDTHTGTTATTDLVIAESTLEELRQVELTSMWGHEHPIEDRRIPTLAEYLGFCREGNKVAIIELKEPMDAGDIALLVDEVKRHSSLDMVTFISFHLDNLIVLRELLPKQSLQYLTAPYSDAIMEAMDKYNLDLDIAWPPLNPNIIKLAHEHGHLVNTWNVDDPADAEKFISWGVDFITSNFLE